MVLFFFLAAGGGAATAVAPTVAAPSPASSPEFPGPDMDLFIPNRIDDMIVVGVVVHR